jgi:hypothetical protein
MNLLHPQKHVDSIPKAVIYLCTYKNQVDSIEIQKELCNKLCGDKGIVVFKFIIIQNDDNLKHRTELYRVIDKELKRGDVVVIFSINEFSCSQEHVWEFVGKLRKKKCRLLTYSENIDTDKDDKMIGIHAWVAEIESRSICERMNTFRKCSNQTEQPTVTQIEATTVQKNTHAQLLTKPLPMLRAMLRRCTNLGLTEEDILLLSHDNCAELLCL